eukprot:6214436-Pleurochrysis_carterae.AAC.3
MFFSSRVMWSATLTTARRNAPWLADQIKTFIALPPDYSLGLSQPTCAKRAHFDGGHEQHRKVPGGVCAHAGGKGVVGLTYKFPHSHALATMTAGTRERNVRNVSIQMRACTCGCAAAMRVRPHDQDTFKSNG